MPVEVRGAIKYNPGVKDHPDYIISCPQLDVLEEGSGDIEEMIEELRGTVTAAIADEFKVAPSAVQIMGYSMGISFSIEGPINKTLDEFTKEKEKTGAEE